MRREVATGGESGYGEAAEPQIVGRYGVLPVAAGVAHQQHPAQRGHYLEAVGAHLAADRVDHDVEALPAQGSEEVFARDDLVVGQG
jgi:hypothetical protein